MGPVHRTGNIAPGSLYGLEPTFDTPAGASCGSAGAALFAGLVCRITFADCGARHLVAVHARSDPIDASRNGADAARGNPRRRRINIIAREGFTWMNLIYVKANGGNGVQIIRFMKRSGP